MLTCAGACVHALVCACLCAGACARVLVCMLVRGCLCACSYTSACTRVRAWGRRRVLVVVHAVVEKLLEGHLLVGLDAGELALPEELLEMVGSLDHGLDGEVLDDPEVLLQAFHFLLELRAGQEGAVLHHGVLQLALDFDDLLEVVVHFLFDDAVAQLHQRAHHPVMLVQQEIVGRLPELHVRPELHLQLVHLRPLADRQLQQLLTLVKHLNLVERVVQLRVDLLARNVAVARLVQVIVVLNAGEILLDLLNDALDAFLAAREPLQELVLRLLAVGLGLAQGQVQLLRPGIQDEVRLLDQRVDFLEVVVQNLQQLLHSAELLLKRAHVEVNGGDDLLHVHQLLLV